VDAMWTDFEGSSKIRSTSSRQEKEHVQSWLALFPHCFSSLVPDTVDLEQACQGAISQTEHPFTTYLIAALQRTNTSLRIPLVISQSIHLQLLPSTQSDYPDAVIQLSPNPNYPFTQACKTDHAQRPTLLLPDIQLATSDFETFPFKSLHFKSSSCRPQNPQVRISPPDYLISCLRKSKIPHLV